MKFRINLLILLIFSFIDLNNVYAFESKKFDMFDNNRSRKVPVVIYRGKMINKPLIIISHGYSIKNTEYSFIANMLAEDGYFVVSIQHDLETDKLLLQGKGNVFDRRKSLWERGVENISFVIEQLRNIQPEIDLNKVILIGHSNGGDISMMFAKLNPEMVSKIISLDSRRHPFPRNLDIKILRFGVSDDTPDQGVVSENAEVIYVKKARHINLCDRGSESIKKEIQKAILQFLDG